MEPVTPAPAAAPVAAPEAVPAPVEPVAQPALTAHTEQPASTPSAADLGALAQQAQGLGTAQPPPCQTVAKVQAEAISKLTEAVAAQDARLASVEKKSKSMSADFDGDEATERLEKAEKAIRDLRKTLRDIKEGA